MPATLLIPTAVVLHPADAAHLLRETLTKTSTPVRILQHLNHLHHPSYICQMPFVFTHPVSGHRLHGWVDVLTLVLPW